MLAIRRSRAFLPAVLVVVGVLIGFFVMQSQGSDDNDNGPVDTVGRDRNCNPVARADAAATRPGETVLVDVLANDTDADEDELVFQILSTEGGSAEIEDGDTPTDSSDDRLAFTPADPPAETATVEYQSLDPQGGFSTSTLTIAINPNAALPDGVRSALATDPAVEGSESGRCGDTVDTTSTTLDSGPVGPETEGVNTTTTTIAEVEEDDDTTATTRGRRTVTTRKSTSPNRTTTTTRRPPSSGGGTTNTTARPPSGGPDTTDAPSVTAPGDPGGPTTTRPPSPPPTDSECGSPQTNPNFEECIRNKGSAPTTSTPA